MRFHLLPSNLPGATLAALAAAALTACGGGGGATTGGGLGEGDTIAIVADTPGPTPFIHLVKVLGNGLSGLQAVDYVIEPKATAASAAIDVTYSMAWLTAHGYVSSDGGVTIPVFGLYAGYQNVVDLTLRFTNASSKSLSTHVGTDAYVDPNGVFDHGTVLQARAKGSSLGFDYFMVRSGIAGPVIMDTDGEVRWVSPSWVAPNAFSAVFRDNGILVGSPDADALTRFELDGTYTQLPLATSLGTGFHHDIDPGKTGLFGELQTATYPESLLVEFDTAGTVSKDWDLSALVAGYMQQHGDDPTLFVRADADWFHMNSAAYDPGDDGIVVSSRENFLIKLDYQTGDIRWILGDPTKYWYTFPSLRAKALALDAGGLYPIGQHAVSITSDGSLMVFNDGMASTNQPAGAPVGESRTYSAVSAYTIDEATMTAHEAWRFDHGQTLYSPACSSAYDAGDGSLLVDYATTDNSTTARLMGLDPSHAVVFDLQFPSPGKCVTASNSEPVPMEAMQF